MHDLFRSGHDTIIVPTGISFLFALKWFENPSCIILFKHISHVDSRYIMYDCVHQLCNAIQAMTMDYLFDSQSSALFKPKAIFNHYYVPPQIVCIFCRSVPPVSFSHARVTSVAQSALCINAARRCPKGKKRSS